MGELIPTFDSTKEGTSTVGTELWVDLGLIPSGKKIWFGYASFISHDKSISFEVRTNTSGNSTGTTGTTKLHDYSSCVAGDYIDRDLCRGGDILLMSAESTGVEHWWLRLKSGSANNGDVDYMIYYTEY